MLKNVIEISLGILFIIANILIALNSKVCGRYIFLAFLFLFQDEVKLCEIELINRDSSIVMQCRQKRHDIIINLLWIFTTTLIFHVSCNICTVIWALPSTGLRKT